MHSSLLLLLLLLSAPCVTAPAALAAVLVTCQDVSPNTVVTTSEKRWWKVRKFTLKAPAAAVMRSLANSGPNSSNLISHAPAAGTHCNAADSADSANGLLHGRLVCLLEPASVCNPMPNPHSHPWLRYSVVALLAACLHHPLTAAASRRLL
jgi:hypothetical protein